MAGWRFHLMSLPSRTWVDRDLPLTGAQVIAGFNGPASISGSIPLGYDTILDVNGRLLLKEWGSLIVAEEDGQDPVCAIVDKVSTEGDSLVVEAGGFTAYPTEQPWLGPDFGGVKVDPMDMVRKIWDHLQSYPDGDLGVVVDSTKSPLLIGEPEELNEFTTGAGEDVSFVSGPFRLARWVTDDLGKTLADLASATPFEYREHSAWAGDDITHRLELAYPSLGVRRTHLRFEIGVNVMLPPGLEDSDYASEVLMHGAGEGRKKRSALVTSDRPTGRLRRVKVYTDKNVTSNSRATTEGRAILRSLTGEDDITSVEVIDHESAPFGTFSAGDEIRIQGDAGWVQMDMWVRIVEITTDCDTGRRTLKVEAV